MDLDKARNSIGMAVHQKRKDGQNRNGIIYGIDELAKCIQVEVPGPFYLNSCSPETIVEGHATENVYRERVWKTEE